MPKLKHTFVQGKMNKDLDERLVPNGQYRDAQNIQVVNSEGSDVGAVENILGNTKKNLKALPNTEWDLRFGLTGPVACIGAIKDSQNERIYWFLANENVDAILEYDQVSGVISPVLVDINGVLNFDPNYLITGINILEGMLAWTDDLNEPKIINIETFKAGSSQGAATDLSVHTVVYGRDFIETDVTVVTESPRQELTAVAYPSFVGGPGTGITPVLTNATSGFSNKVPGNQVSVLLTTPVSNDWLTLTNPRVILTTEIEQEDGSVDKYQVIGEVVLITQPIPNQLLIEIESITDGIPGTFLAWEMILIEQDPIFKKDFPRFSYRYKYVDGKYSVFAPFSLPAFVPGEFEYLSRDGNNKGMEGVIRKIDIDNFPTLPDNVIEVEVLYKGSASTNVYVIETISASNVGPFTITSGTLGAIVESNQLLRLYDDVPRKAKAQEVISNRLIYANYLHNYDVNEGQLNISTFKIRTDHTNVGFGIPSIKTNREYQLGVSFLDKFGRESPVFTTTAGAITFDAADAKFINEIEPVLSSSTAELVSNGGWATHFKYYIKNNSPEYYNIALDRFYEAEDNSVWLSFPSSERNKLMEGQYIRLKKQHDSDEAVRENNRYKVLNISNEAPDYIRLTKVMTGRVNCLNYVDSGLPGFIEGNNKIKFLAPIKDKNEGFFEGFSSKGYVQFFNEAGNVKTDYYKIKSGGPIGSNVTDPLQDGDDYAIFEAVLYEGLRSEDFWLYDLENYEQIRCVVYQDEDVPKAEFQGRFFAKITANATFYDNTKEAFGYRGNPLVEDYIFEAFYLDPFSGGWGANETKGIWSINGVPANQNPPVTFATPASGNFDFKIGVAYTDFVGFKNDADWVKYSRISPGNKFKFKYADGTESLNFYTIAETNHYINSNNDPWFAADQTGNLARQVTIVMDRAFDDTQYGGNPSPVEIAGLIFYREQEIGDQNLLSSRNPAIFETEPEELADLDIYYEVSGFIPESDAGQRNTKLNWFNCYSFGNGVESDRINDDYNAPTLGKGVRVSSVLKEPYKAERMGSGLIYSGLYNSISSVNELNQFNTAVKITKNLDPSYGTIQKLHARDTNLVALAEDKVFRIFADKDALYNADGSANLTSTNRVLGEASTFAGEFGISKNPESFASYGFRAYFTDKARGAVLRLSMDGLTDISRNGMTDYFQDELKAASGSIIGAYDENIGTYNIALSNESVSFMEDTNGWTTRLSYSPEFAASLNNEYYTFQDGEIWEHSNQVRSNFYGSQESSTITPLFNDAPSSIKNFKTLSYEGNEGWVADVITDQQDGEVKTWKKKEGIYFNYINGLQTTWSNATQSGSLDASEFSVQGIGSLDSAFIAAPNVFELSFNGQINVSLQPGDEVYYKDSILGSIVLMGNCIAANAPNGPVVVQNQTGAALPAVGDFVFFAKDSEKNTSGIIGYYGQVTMSTTSGDAKELFAVNSEVFISSE